MKLDVAYRFPCAEEFAAIRRARYISRGETPPAHVETRSTFVSQRERAAALGISTRKLRKAEAANG